MARLLTVVLLAAIAAHAVAKPATPSPLEILQDEIASSMTDLYTGSSLLYSSNFFTNKDDAAFVKDALENLFNITEMLADELDLENPLMTDLDAAKKELKGQDANAVKVEGILRVGQAAQTLTNVTNALATNTAVFSEFYNTTAFSDLVRGAELSQILLNLTTTVLQSGSALTSQSAGRRRLQQSFNCNMIDWSRATAAQLKSCTPQQISASLSTTGNSLASSQARLDMQQFQKYCTPYIRSKYSSDFTGSFKSDQTMKTCNDLFGCRECMEGKKDGSFVTQQDCNRVFNRDKQQWRIKPISGKEAYTIENDEYKNCIQAPTTSTGYFTMAKCDGSARQAFDFLEMSRWFGHPRVVVRLYGSDKNGTAPGVCMTTERADDDDGIKFIPRPCACKNSQLISRDD